MQSGRRISLPLRPALSKVEGQTPQGISYGQSRLHNSIDKLRLLHYYYSVVKPRLSILRVSGLQLQGDILQ
jgi:hypothetical protein